MLRRLVVVLLVALCALTLASMCGSVRVGYQGGYSGQAAGRRVGYAGGGAAGWDTVTLFLACKPDTTHFDARFGYDRTAAGASGKLRLGVNTQFRYDTVAQDDTTESAFSYSQIRWRTVFPNTADGGALNYDPGATYRWALLTYVNWEDIIPDGSHVVSAELKGLVVTGANHANFGAQDSVMSILMSAPADSVWRTPVAGKTIANGCTYNGFANWNWQRWGTDNGASAGRGHPAVSVKRWNPTLISRTQPWNIGEWADLCGRNVSAIAPDSLVTIDITNCVQGAVNGAVNNGIMTYICSNESAAAWYFYLNGFQGNGSLTKQPWFKVKYITKKYAAPFPNGKRWAFLFSTDDQVLKANTAYVDAFKQHNAGFSIFVRKDAVGLAHYANWDTLIAWRNAGMEIGSHSRYHWGTWPSGVAFGSGVSAKWYGLNSYHSRWGDIGTYTPRCGLAACTTGYDSLLYDSEPYWLYDGFGANGGGDATADPYVGKALATPGNIYRAEVIKAVSHHGYVAARTGSANYMTAPSGDRPYGFLADFRRSAPTDTFWSGMLAHDQRQPRNLVWQPLRYTAANFSGPRSDTLSAGHLDSCATIMRRAGYLAAANKTGVVSVMSHDIKGSRTNYYNGASTMLNANELESMLDGVDAGGGWIARASEYARWNQANATPINTPPAYAQNDSFTFDAADRTWFVLDGVGSRFVRGLKDNTILAKYDVTPPDAPAIIACIPGSASVTLVWSAPSPTEPTWYKVYRFFDGAADTTYLGTTILTYWTDSTAINGSPHNYFVTSGDVAGNESQDSEHVTTTPGAILSVGRPVYASIWYQNRPDATALTPAALDSLAEFDALVTWSYPFKTGGANEASMDNLLTNLRTRNANQVLLTYIITTAIDNDWATFPAGSPERKTWNFCASHSYAGVDSAGFAYNKAGYVAEGDEFNNKFPNVLYPALADTLAKYWVAAFDGTDSDGEYAGLFVDVADSTLADHLCDGRNCTGHIDFDHDTTAYASDAAEKAAFQTYQIGFIKALRREFAQRLMPNRLIVANTTFGRKLAAYQTANDSTMLGLLDGVLVEGFNELWPGNKSSAADWNTAQAQNSLLVHAQTSPPLMLWHPWANDSSQEMAEVAALAVDGFACAQNDSDYNGEDAIPDLGDRLPAPGLYSGFTVTSGAAEDTLTAKWTALKGRMWTERNPVQAAGADSVGSVWPYVAFVPTTHDTLRQSVYWENVDEIGNPPAPLYHTRMDDSFIELWPYIATTDDGLTWLTEDFSHFRIVKEWVPEAATEADTFYVDPDTLVVAERGTSDEHYIWTDPSVSNGTEYCYRVTAVDVLGNESAETYLADQCRTPVDIVPPPEGQANATASGGEGFVAIDWEYPNQPDDFDHFTVDRRPVGSGSYSALGVATTSAYNDSTAVSGHVYEYYIEAVDDDGLTAQIGDAPAVGAWYGTVEPTYPPPSQVRAIGNYSGGKTAVVVYPPSDVTGLSSYTVYRGSWNGVAATDTSACLVYKADLAPDAFNGHVLIDNFSDTTPDSAFQYTARAIYSGHASAKYAIPAGAFSNGGFAATTPTCTPMGNGSSIMVVVPQLAGADSTRIYRGTTSGSQAYLATINASAGLYSDTTALANTDYYYRAREYDVATDTWSNYSAVGGPVRWVSVPAGSPTISGVTGTIANGQSVVIAGNNFGSKTNVAPVAWDNFEGHSNGSALASGGYWTRIATDTNTSTQHTSTPRYTTAKSHGGSVSLLCPFETPTDNSSFWLENVSRMSHEFYLDAWIWYDPGPVYTRSWKPWIMYDSTSNENVLIDWFGDCNGGATISTHAGGSQLPDQVWRDVNSSVAGGVAQFTGGWHHIQVYSKLSSPAGTRTGIVWVARDGTVIVNRTDMYLLAADATVTWGRLALGYYNSRDMTGCTGVVGNNYMWWDDVFVDSGRQRVEIGNNATYSLCTHREIQIPSAWAANGTSITATLNTGTFLNTDPVWLFVVDSDGNASAGQSITIANP